MEGSDDLAPHGQREAQPDLSGIAAGPSNAPNTTQAVPQVQPAVASSSSGSAPRTRMLLACDRCRSRKSKEFALLHFLPPSRSAIYIEDLERRARDLQGEYENILAQTGPGGSDLLSPFSGNVPGIAVGIESGPGIVMPPGGNPVTTSLANQPQAAQPMAGSPIGDPLSFGNTLLQAIRLSGIDPLRASAPNLLFTESSTAFNNLTALSLLQGMDKDVLVDAMTMYFEFIHAHYPLLVREDITNKFNIMTERTYQAGGMHPAEELVVYLVLVIGMTVSPGLRSVPIYPQMLYQAALRAPNLFDDTESIPMTQALILIVVYSLYDPCAGSSWHLLDIVVGKCLSMGLHLVSSALGNGIESAAKTWAFWTLYSLDRMSGASMGRPFTIANDDIITVPVPGIRRPGRSDGTGFLSGPLITYFQLLYRARRDPDVGFDHWQHELSRWRDSTKTSVALDIQANAANPASGEYLEAMNTYIDLIYYQGLLLVPQFNVEYPTITPQIQQLYGSETMYTAAKMVGLSFSVHRFPLAWTAGYKAFATGMSYLLSLTQYDRGKVTLPEIYHVSTACINTIENVAGKFHGLTPYGKFLVKATDMMLRLFSVESDHSSIASDPHFLYTPYSDVIPRSPNSGVPRPPDVSELHVRKFRCLSRLYLVAMEDIRSRMFPNT
ncbi:hypothetical protein ABW19_dt0201864 [Dactylella cylindrospora]|nr:hypothetical protein ABW19_dt0201864 [Dactylella cylindrospora]